MQKNRLPLEMGIDLSFPMKVPETLQECYDVDCDVCGELGRNDNGRCIKRHSLISLERERVKKTIPQDVQRWYNMWFKEDMLTFRNFCGSVEVPIKSVVSSHTTTGRKTYLKCDKVYIVFDRSDGTLNVIVR